jgi:hypothetical protein
MPCGTGEVASGIGERIENTLLGGGFQTVISVPGGVFEMINGIPNGGVHDVVLSLVYAGFYRTRSTERSIPRPAVLTSLPNPWTVLQEESVAAAAAEASRNRTDRIKDCDFMVAVGKR